MAIIFSKYAFIIELLMNILCPIVSFADRILNLKRNVLFPINVLIGLKMVLISDICDK
jgi:hypothetical protein